MATGGYERRENGLVTILSVVEEAALSLVLAQRFSQLPGFETKRIVWTGLEKYLIRPRRNPRRLIWEAEDLLLTAGRDQPTSET